MVTAGLCDEMTGTADLNSLSFHWSDPTVCQRAEARQATVQIGNVRTQCRAINNRELHQTLSPTAYKSAPQCLQNPASRSWPSDMHSGQTRVEMCRPPDWASSAETMPVGTMIMQ